MAIAMELAKSHHFVGNLMVLRPISSSHELSCFNEKSNSKRILELYGLYFQVRYQYIDSSIQKNRLAVTFNYILLAYRNLLLPPNVQTLLFQDGRQQNIEITKPKL